MKKVINFVNRTLAEIAAAYERLKKRYRKISFKFTTTGALRNGYFIIK